MAVRYNPALVTLSIVVAIFASYVALGLAGAVVRAKGRARALWLTGGALAMGFGIWSMHFVGMLAFEMPGMSMAYDVPLMVLSILIAIGASAIALSLVSRAAVSVRSFVASGIAMAAAIAGMHYTGMYSMRMDATIEWNHYLVALSVVIALVASFLALFVAMHLRKISQSWKQAIASVIMGIAIAGMHYTGMAAAKFIHTGTTEAWNPHFLLASSELTAAVLSATALILGLAFASSTIDRAFGRRMERAEEIDRLFREAQRAIRDLENERELRERFVSALAHDLRNPIAAARLGTQLGFRKAMAGEEAEKSSRKVLDSLDRADQMIQDLLDAHRISAGQALPLHKTHGNLKALLRGILDDLTVIHGDRFVLQCEEADLWGDFDARYLRRAIENLCTNAVKYGQEGAPIYLNVASKDDGISISVRNQGEPLQEAEWQNLFRLFHRGQEAQATGKRGWGLGLSIVKGIAEAHGGAVRVDSRAESGTTFFIELPWAGGQSGGQVTA